MKEMLAEYGLIIVTSVCVLIFLAFATPLGTAITNSITGVVDGLIEKSDLYFANVDVEDFGAAAGSSVNG